MQKKTILISSIAAGAVLVLGGTGIALAVTEPWDNDNDGDRLSGTTLDRASEAALAEVGSGRVSDAETSNDLDHRYEVEVRLDNGSQIDVHLDENFDVVWVENDGSDDNNGSTSGATTAPSTAPSAGATTAPVTGTVDPEDVPITDAERASATAAAIAAVGEGTVTDLDRSDDADHAFEVEVTFADGTDADVELDANFVMVDIDR